MSLKNRALLILTIWILISSCTANNQKQPFPIQDEISIDGIGFVEIDVSAGTVSVLNGDGNRVEVVGSSSNPKSFVIDQRARVLEISLQSVDDDDSITVFVPTGFSFTLTTFRANLDIQGSFGTFSIRSTAGKVWVHEFEGDGVIWAGRGDVHVEGGEGSIEIISEHGDQSVERFLGPVSMTSIMGNLHYFGKENDENVIGIEVDHGSVRVDLPSNAEHSVDVTSTSGVVTCVGEGLAQSVSGCEGVLGSGVGALDVRTVSGNVNLWVVRAVEDVDE